MTTRFAMATREAFVDRQASENVAVKLPPTIAAQWAEFRSAWLRWLAHHRFRRSIAHLDDRLLADIGLGPQELGFAERLIRGRAASLPKSWSLGEAD
jgi:uncharacterized protein YjiS (DUF1127 family)